MMRNKCFTKPVAMVLLFAMLLTTCFSNILLTTNYAQAAGAEIPAYMQFVDKDGNFAFDDYTQEELFINLTKPLEYSCQGLSLTEFYDKYKESNPEYFISSEGIENYKQLVSSCKEKEYAEVTKDNIVFLKGLAQAILNNENLWPTFCYYQKLLPTKGYLQVCNKEGQAVIDLKTTELYVCLSAPLDYCGYGYSLKDYYDANKEQNPQYFGTDGEDYYQKIASIIGEKEFSKVTPEIQSYLKELYKAFKETSNAEEYWKFCYYYGDTTTPRDENLGKIKLVYGNENLADKDAFVILITGDGFARSDSSKFQTEVEKFTKNLLETAPYNELADAIKIYSIKTVSKDTGIPGDKAKNTVEMLGDKRSTYFGSSFWADGSQQTIAFKDNGAKVESVLKSYPEVDCGIVLVNSNIVGSARGENYAVGSLSEEGYRLLKNELAYVIAKVVENNNTESSKELLRKAICRKSNVTQLFFQPYQTIFLEKSEPQNLLNYMILRKGDNESYGAELLPLLHVTYFDKTGAEVPVMITDTSGSYKMKVEFDGNSQYSKISREFVYNVVVAIDYNSMGGTYESDSYGIIGNAIGDTMPVPTKEGYTFLGWYTDPIGGIQINKDTIILGSMSLFAHWVKNYDVNFEANGSGANVSETVVTVNSGEEIGDLPEATREGYTFEGWYTKKNGGTQLSESSTVSRNITCYARWAKVKVDKVSKVKLKRGKKSIKVSYKRLKKISGYQIKYSSSKKMKGYKVLSTKGTMRTLTKLRSSKVYYVKIRAYTYDSLGIKIYGKWSSMKSCKTK